MNICTTIINTHIETAGDLSSNAIAFKELLKKNSYLKNKFGQCTDNQ